MLLKTLDAKVRFMLSVVVLFLLMTGPFLLTATLIWLDAHDAERTSLTQLIVPRLPLGTFLTAAGFACGVALILNLFRGYVGGLQQMAEHLTLLLDANRHFKIKTDGPPEVRALADAANALAIRRNDLVDTIQAQISAANARIEDEKSLLATLVSELSQAILVCNREGKILLYNQRAKVLSPEAIGLGRSIYRFLEREQIDHAQEVIERRLISGTQKVQASFVTSLKNGQLLRIQTVPVLPKQMDPSALSVNGYVLTIENITQTFEHEKRRDVAFSGLVSEIRGDLSNLVYALQGLQKINQSAEATVIQESAETIRHRLDASMLDFASMLKFRWPLDEVHVEDIVLSAARRLEDRLGIQSSFERPETPIWIRADSYHLVFVLQFLANQLQLVSDIRTVAFRTQEIEGQVFIDVVWHGQMVSSETVATWEIDVMQVGEDISPLSLREVLSRHNAEFHYERHKAQHAGCFRLVFPKASPDQGLMRLGTDGPECYDFDLFNATEMGDVLDRPLKDIAYTVFDTETTGLEPSKGDEIIQIGAIRIVNNRLLAQETFDQLVDPRFPLPPAGIPIHGITDQMVKGQPHIDTVLPTFHAFAQDTVLVAHNAAFDMRFLQLKEASLKVHFGQPVLDTLLLSSVVQPHQDSHSLDAIAERLGIAVTARHNALGDAWVTAAVFLKLIPLLEDKGVVTLRQAIEASEKTHFARVKY